jgi:autoinducer 2-degrading protein
MVVRPVTVRVKEEHVEAFITATRKNHEGSLREPGVLRFDVLQCVAEPTRFLLYEVYRDEGAAEVHKTTAHYREWKKAVEPMMAEPRESTAFAVIAPQDSARWK